MQDSEFFEKKHKILVIESNVSLKNRLHTILSDNGYIVNSFDIANQALENLKTSKESPYTLVISNYEMPEMRGDEILKNTKEITLDTQRLLIADDADLQTLINAVNKTEIHSCLTLPFENEPFLTLVNHCCHQYENNLKKKNLTQTIHRQNKQLFQRARQYKEKEALYVDQIKKGKKEIRILESRIECSENGSIVCCEDLDQPYDLKNILEQRNLSFLDNLGDEFIIIKDQIKQIMETAALSHSITLDSISYNQIVKGSLSTGNMHHLAATILPIIYPLLEKNESPDIKFYPGNKNFILDDHFKLKLSTNKSKAIIKVNTIDKHTLNLDRIKEFLEKNNIINGIKDDHEINKWLQKADVNDEPFIIAQAIEPVYPKNAQIKYHFPINFLHAGKINEDGSINFHDRGEIPYVEEEELLAEKIFPQKGRPGIDVLGNPIMVGDPVDLAFSSGPGTILSENGDKIYAVTAGQPHLDALGNITVCPEYQVKGDLGFETGDINFDGNVVVNGSVRPGFKVKCVSLTAREIQGANIDIKGDLNVSLGIIDTELIKVKGSVQAKFVQNSTINAFGDMIVQKEIIDSKINLSGACINKTGLIINSKISAKRGIDAGSIGTSSSKPSILTVGIDGHINPLLTKIDTKLEINNNAIKKFNIEIKKLEKEDQELHAFVSKHAYTQDRSELEIKEIEKKLQDFKNSGDTIVYQNMKRKIKKLKKKAEQSEENIHRGFHRQDEVILEISRKNSGLKELEGLNEKLLDEKNSLLEFTGKTKPLPEIKVARKIESRTKIFAIHSSLILNKTSYRCRIREVTSITEGVNGLEFHELKIEKY